MGDSRKFYAFCDTDRVTVIIDAHPDHGPGGLPEIEDWDNPFFSCPICGGGLGAPDTDPTSTDDDINWHRKKAGEGIVRRLLGAEDRDAYLEQLRAYYNLEVV